MSYCICVKCVVCKKDVHTQDCRSAIPFMLGAEHRFHLCDDCLAKQTLASVRDMFPLEEAKKKCFFCDVCEKHANTVDTQEVRYGNQTTDVCDGCAVTLTFADFLARRVAIMNRCSI